MRVRFPSWPGLTSSLQCCVCTPTHHTALQGGYVGMSACRSLREARGSGWACMREWSRRIPMGVRTYVHTSFLYEVFRMCFFSSHKSSARFLLLAC